MQATIGEGTYGKVKMAIEQASGEKVNTFLFTWIITKKTLNYTVNVSQVY